VTISRIPDRQATKSRRHPVPKFGESRFPRSSQIPNPVKMFCVFPNPAPYFGQIPDPENTLSDPVSTSCASNVLAGKPLKHSTFTSAGLRVLAAQELLAPLLARALFLGCTVLVC